MHVEMKTVGFAIYAPPALRKFLEARATGNASKELLLQLSEAAMAEQEAELAKRPKADIIDFHRARAEKRGES
jgi:hypothetical protein